jgi:hypothetical protein
MSGFNWFGLGGLLRQAFGMTQTALGAYIEADIAQLHQAIFPDDGQNKTETEKREEISGFLNRISIKYAERYRLLGNDHETSDHYLAQLYRRFLNLSGNVNVGKNGKTALTTVDLLYINAHPMAPTALTGSVTEQDRSHGEGFVILDETNEAFHFFNTSNVERIFTALPEQDQKKLNGLMSWVKQITPSGPTIGVKLDL